MSRRRQSLGSHLSRLRAQGVLGRAVAIAAGCVLALAVWSALSPSESQGDHLELRLDFAVREWLGRAPALDPRLKIFVLDDQTVAYLQAGDLPLHGWAELLEALAARKPSRIIIDKLFDLPRDLSEAPSFVERLQRLPTPVVTGAFVAPRRIPARPELSLDAPWNDIRRFSDAADAAKALGDSPAVARAAYGPHPALAPGLRYPGHLGYRGLGRVAAVERIDARSILPHAALHPVTELDAVDGRLLVNGRHVPMHDGTIQVNFASLDALDSRIYSMRGLIARTRARGPISVVNESDVVLILPGMFTGSGDWTMTPLGQIPGGYVLASVINSTMTGAWLITVDAKLPLLVAAVVIGLLCGLTLFGRALWIATTCTVIAIAVAGLGSFAFAGVVLPWMMPAAAFFVTAMTVFVERSRVERGHRLRMEAELETAGLVQRAFLPKEARRIGALTVIGRCKPASQCGGDWWWHFSPTPGVEFVLIGDVTGHGTPAALVTSALYSALSTMTDLWDASAGLQLSPARILKTLNRMLFESVGGERLVTMVVARFDLDAGTLTFANAAHHAPLLFRGSKRINLDVSRPGHMLGFESEGGFRETTVTIAAGDKLVFYTDGVIERSTADGRPLGKRAFTAIATRLAEATADAMADGLTSELFTTVGKEELEDDCTIVIVEVPAEWRARGEVTEASAS